MRIAASACVGQRTLCRVTESSARRLVTSVLDEPTVDLADALIPRWVKDPNSGEANHGEDDERRRRDCDLDKNGSSHSHGQRRGAHRVTARSLSGMSGRLVSAHRNLGAGRAGKPILM